MDTLTGERGDLTQTALTILALIYKNYPNYEQYMVFFNHPRILIAQVRLKNSEISAYLKDISQMSRVCEQAIKRGDVQIAMPSTEKVNLEEIKYYRYPNLYAENYFINGIEDSSIENRKRFRLNLFVNDTTNKSEIIKKIKSAVNDIKNFKNLPQTKVEVKNGEMEADSLYLYVYHSDTRDGKSRTPKNDNYICFADYNIDGRTSLNNGGFPPSLWTKFYHEKIDLLNIAWNDEKYKVVKVGRNEPCTCNSGKKYKKCCGQ